MEAALAVLLGYLVGSVPFAFLLSRRRNIDLRVAGSGNVGATNVLRTSGVPLAIATMCLDAAKGSLAVIVAQRMASPGAAVAAGLGSVIGHVYPVWLGFRGGKGVATAAGVFGVLAPVSLAIAAGAFLVGVIGSRHVSVGSLAGALTLAGATLATAAPRSVAIGAALAALLILFRHRGNVSRLLSGTEHRIGARL